MSFPNAIITWQFRFQFYTKSTSTSLEIQKQVVRTNVFVVCTSTAVLSLPYVHANWRFDTTRVYSVECVQKITICVAFKDKTECEIISCTVLLDKFKLLLSWLGFVMVVKIPV